MIWILEFVFYASRKIVNLFLFILSEHKMIDDEVTLLSLDLALFKSCLCLYYHDSPAFFATQQQPC